VRKNVSKLVGNDSSSAQSLPQPDGLGYNSQDFPQLWERTPKGNEGGGEVGVRQEVFGVDTTKAREVLCMRF
jgi:hypothetical protein